MSAAQEVGFMRPEYHIDLDIRVPRLRPPPTNFFVYAECEDPYPTTPPGVLTMDDDDCGIRTVPPDPADEAAALAAEPNAFPPTERPTRPETIRPSVRDFNRAVDEMTLTRKEIADGFKHQGADLAFIRHELQGQSMRLTKVEDGQRDLRAELRQVKDDLRGALDRIEELEKRYDSSPPSASPR
jgi:hypothetical protein